MLWVSRMPRHNCARAHLLRLLHPSVQAEKVPRACDRHVLVLQASKHLLYPLCVPLARRCAPDSPARPDSLLAHSIAPSPGSQDGSTP